MITTQNPNTSRLLAIRWSPSKQQWLDTAGHIWLMDDEGNLKNVSHGDLPCRAWQIVEAPRLPQKKGKK